MRSDEGKTWQNSGAVIHPAAYRQSHNPRDHAGCDGSQRCLRQSRRHRFRCWTKFFEIDKFVEPSTLTQFRTAGATLSGAIGLAMDSQRNLDVADSSANQILKITLARGFGGDLGKATDALLNAPRAVAVDGSGKRTSWCRPWQPAVTRWF